MNSEYNFECLATQFVEATPKQRLWIDRLIAWQHSGLTLAEFARVNDYAYSNLSAWRLRMQHKFRQPHQMPFGITDSLTDRPLFQQLKPSIPATDTLSLVVKLPNGIECRLTTDQVQVIHFIQGLAQL